MTSADTARQTAERLAAVAGDKKATDIVIYRVTELIGITDYFVVATTDNPRQIKAILNEVSRRARAEGLNRLATEGTPESGWVLVDFDQVVLHLFSRSARDYYDFDLLWGDAERVDWQPADRHASPK